MAYQAVLDGLVASVPGAHAALLLDQMGEVVVEAGARDERHRLIGAYQGIALTNARRLGSRYATGDLLYFLCRYASGAVVLRPLKDGYYLIVSLGSHANVVQGLRHSEVAQQRLDAEL